MKNKMKKFWLIAMCVAAITTLVSAVPASADTSRVVWFTVQNNNVCSTTNQYATIYFNINNISNNAGSVTLYLYNDNGTPVSYPGYTIPGAYLASDIIPGTPKPLNAKTTAHYMLQFGGNDTTSDSIASCSERVAFGKIVVNSDDGLFMANGEVKGTWRYTNNTTDINILTNTPIVINNGQPF